MFYVCEVASAGIDGQIEKVSQRVPENAGGVEECGKSKNASCELERTTSAACPCP